MESRARDQARWLIRDRGDDAEDGPCANLYRENVSDADHYRHKLTLGEIARLRCSDPRKYGPSKQQGLLGSNLGIFS